MNTLKITITSFCFAATSIFSYAQSVKSSTVFVEKIKAHTNTDFLVTGETLYYSIHCLNGKNEFSTLSKLAYVELIGENEKSFLQAKISLEEGSGAGDFFLPSTLPSGNYMLIAYTKWMRNFPVDDFFQKQITIVNPYLKSSSSNAHRNDDKIIAASRSVKDESKINTSPIQVSSVRRKYSQRQRVVVVLKNEDPLRDFKISLNVHSYDKEVATSSKFDLVINDTVNSVSLSERQKKTVPITVLPDFRGETIGGVVRDRGSRRPIANANIYLSAPGTTYFFQISKTDSTGRFYFSTKNIQTHSGIQFQIESESGSSVEVILDNEFVDDYRKFKPSPFSIDTAMRRQVEKRNVYSQIENAYYVKKRDSILVAIQPSFFGVPDKVYNLDDFTRFPTMEDIFREYMFEVVVSKRDKKFILQLISSRNSSRFLNSPLILVDGTLVLDTEILMNYNPLIIKSISLVTRQYVYAGILFDGILSIDTYEGKAKDLPVTSINKDYTSVQHSKKYYSPAYDVNDDLKRIPDYRVQLFWNPTISIKSGEEIKVEFYTSDVVGDFLIEAVGYSSQGESVDSRQSIEVRK